MLSSPKVKRAFDLSAEPDRLRDDYGRTTYGQSCLLARRLVEAGVRFVSVYYSRVDRRQGQRRLGHARRQLQPAQEPAPADHRPGRADPDPGPRGARACSTRRWSSGWANSAVAQGAEHQAIRPRRPRPLAQLLHGALIAGGGIIAGRDLRLERPDRRLSGHRPGHARRHRRDHVLGARHRPGHRGPRHPRTGRCRSRRASRSPESLAKRGSTVISTSLPERNALGAACGRFRCTSIIRNLSAYYAPGSERRFEEKLPWPNPSNCSTEHTQKVTLGCGTLILLAIIVAIFSDHGTREVEQGVDNLRNDVRDLKRAIDCANPADSRPSRCARTGARRPRKPRRRFRRTCWKMRSHERKCCRNRSTNGHRENSSRRIRLRVRKS